LYAFLGLPKLTKKQYPSLYGNDNVLGSPPSNRDCNASNLWHRYSEARSIAIPLTSIGLKTTFCYRLFRKLSSGNKKVEADVEIRKIPKKILI